MFNIATGETYRLKKGRSIVEYYWVRPQIEDRSNELSWDERRKLNTEVYDWVVEKFGEQLDWSHLHRGWMASNNTYYFRKGKDRTMFLLRWA